MPPGIRATVAFTDSVCPIADLSGRADAVAKSAVPTVRTTDEAAAVTEFSMDAEPDPEVDSITKVFSHGLLHRYRYVHDPGIDCPCECLGAFGCPVARYVAREGTLTLVFHAADYEELEVVVAALRERFPDIDIRRLVRSPEEDSASDSVFVDRGKLTKRQLEVLETAHAMGYFEHPRRANATEVADALNINLSTFQEHLAAAESKLLEDLLGGRRINHPE